MSKSGLCTLYSVLYTLSALFEVASIDSGGPRTRLSIDSFGDKSQKEHTGSGGMENSIGQSDSGGVPYALLMGLRNVMGVRLI